MWNVEMKLNYYLNDNGIRIEIPNSKRDRSMESSPNGQIESCVVDMCIKNKERLKFPKGEK